MKIFIDNGHWVDTPGKRILDGKLRTRLEPIECSLDCRRSHRPRPLCPTPHAGSGKHLTFRMRPPHQGHRWLYQVRCPAISLYETSKHLLGQRLGTLVY